MTRVSAGRLGKKSIGDRRGIQSIEVGIFILRALGASNGPMHLRELAAATRMSASKVYRYLVSFADVGMVRQDPATGRYDLGQFCSELGLAVLERIDGLEIVSDALVKLTAETQRDVHTTVWRTAGPTVIRWLQGSLDVAVKVREGVVLPLLRTATGRVWACHLPAEITRPLIEAELDQLEEQSDQSRSALRDYYGERISSVRLNGVSRSQGERRPGIDALSGPIFGPSGLAFVVTIMGSHGDFDLSYDGKPAKALTRILAQASEQLIARSETPVQRGGQQNPARTASQRSKLGRVVRTSQ
jgi:DNA-binding IclR family transcriptional regulator